MLLLRFNLNQTMKIYEAKKTYGYSTKILTYNFKSIKAMGVKEKTRKPSRRNETKET